MLWTLPSEGEFLEKNLKPWSFVDQCQLGSFSPKGLVLFVVWGYDCQGDFSKMKHCILPGVCWAKERSTRAYWQLYIRTSVAINVNICKTCLEQYEKAVKRDEVGWL